MFVNVDECIAAGLDPKEINRIAAGITRYALQAQALGVQVFGGTGTGSLRFDDSRPGRLILAELDGDFDGGDGGERPSSDGLRRGE
jgi:flagellin-like hook-associated protein FlgL